MGIAHGMRKAGRCKSVPGVRDQTQEGAEFRLKCWDSMAED